MHPPVLRKRVGVGFKQRQNSTTSESQGAIFLHLPFSPFSLALLRSCALALFRFSFLQPLPINMLYQCRTIRKIAEFVSVRLHREYDVVLLVSPQQSPLLRVCVCVCPCGCSCIRPSPPLSLCRSPL